MSVVSRWLVIAGLLILLSCGGGGTSGGGGINPPPATFSLSLSSSALSIAAAGSGSVTVKVTGSSGFTSIVSITATNLPTGVTVSPSNANLAAGQSQQFIFTAASYAGISDSTVSVTGSTGTGSQQAALDLQVTAYAGNIALPRTRYVRTDAVQPDMVLFDSATDRFFMSDPGSNQIFVLSASTRQLIGSIPVPGAFGMDETPDQSVLYAGTQIGDLYAINPVTMVVTHRYVASQIGPNGYHAYAVQAMANGELALLGGQGGIPGVDGYSGFAFWNPVNNSIQTYGSGHSVRSCADGGYIFTFAATGDRSLLVLENQNLSGTTASEICTISPVTGQTNSVSTAGSPVTPTPDGKSILVLQYGIQATMIVLNAQTLTQTASFPVGDFSAGTYVVVSPDSSTVYLAPELGGIVYAFDLSSGAQVGWLPDIYTNPIGTWITAIDNAGLLAGVNVEGIGFLDAAAMQNGPVGTSFLNGYLTPNTGPISGATAVNMGFETSQNLAAVYFGQTLAPSISPNPPLLYATTPPGSPGPVDVVSLMTDGGMQILPEAFSYGPTILEITPNASTAEGGGTGVIFGFAFGPNTGPFNQIPQGLQVSVGGQAVQITGYNPEGYSYGTAPTPLVSLSYTIPPGGTGTASDVTVTTPAGSATASAGLQYLPATQPISLGSAVSLAQGIYDSIRDVYYFTDASEIRVYSRSQNQWLTSIQVPAAPTGTTHRLWGIALSPNGSNLAVADAAAGMIYLIDPDSPGSVRSFVFNQAYFSGSPIPPGNGLITNPAGVAVSDSGMIYLGAFTVGGDGYDFFFKLDTTSGQITDYQLYDCAMAPLYKVAISSDNSHVFLDDGGMVFSLATATDTLTRASADAGGCYGDYDVTVSSGQTTLEATSYLYDINANAESYLVLNDRESSNITYVYGTQLSADGTLLFQPSTNGIDVYDGRLGTLRSRIELPFDLSQNYDALVADGKDNVLIAITGNRGSGISVVDLSSLVEPAPLPYEASVFPGTNLRSSMNGPASGPRRRGATLEPHVMPRFKVPHVTNRILFPKPALQRKQTAP
jgi:DNA-binding beta-propeller fold protein YncE